jgi:excisionase family DNA binding protein
MEKRFLTVNECAEYLCLHKKTIYQLVYAHKLPSVKIGGSVRIDLKRLTEQLESQQKTKGGIFVE